MIYGSLKQIFSHSDRLLLLLFFRITFMFTIIGNGNATVDLVTPDQEVILPWDEKDIMRYV